MKYSRQHRRIGRFRGTQTSSSASQRRHLRPGVFWGATRVFFCVALDSRGPSPCRNLVLGGVLLPRANQGSV